jgi:hypothetical protein
VSVLSYGSSFSFCTGTLIDIDLVLTAKHCVNKAYTDEIFIVYGENVINPDSNNLIPVLVKGQHYENVDLALLLLSKIPRNVQYVNILPPERYEEVLNVNDAITIAGYSRTSKNEKLGVLNFGENKIESREDDKLVSGSQNSGGNVCFGDAGGPGYVRHNYIRFLAAVGVNRTQDECNLGSMFILPGLHQDWIDNTTSLMQEAADNPCSECPSENGNKICNINKGEMGCDGCNTGGKPHTLVFIIFMLVIIFFYGKIVKFALDKIKK